MGFYKTRAVAALVLLFGFVAQLPEACTGPSVNETPDTSRGGGPTPARSASDILGDPTRYYGDTVTIRGEVSDVITPVAFEMGGEKDTPRGSDRYGGTADGLLVVNDTGRAPAPKVEVGQTVEVTGEVREFDVREVERQTNKELADRVFTYWASNPSVVATSVEQTG